MRSRQWTPGLFFFFGICLVVLVVVALPVLVPSAFVPVDLFVLFTACICIWSVVFVCSI